MKTKHIARSLIAALTIVLGANSGTGQETNMHLRLVPLDDAFNPISEVFVDVTRATNIVNIGAFVRGGAGISPTEIVNTFTIRYWDPDPLGSNYITRSATSYAFTSNPGPYPGVFEGFDVGAFNNVSTNNGSLSQFQTDILGNGMSYGPHPADFTNGLGRLVEVWGVEFTTNVTSGLSTNLGIVTTRTWRDQNNYSRTMVWDSPNYTITFVPEPSACALMLTGAAAFWFIRRQRK